MTNSNSFMDSPDTIKGDNRKSITIQSLSVSRPESANYTNNRKRVSLSVSTMKKLKLVCVFSLLVLFPFITIVVTTPTQLLDVEENGYRSEEMEIPEPRDNSEISLSEAFIPHHYDVELRLILDEDQTETGGNVGKQYTAPGSVRISGVNQAKSSQITLHSKDLEINETSVKVASKLNGGRSMDIKSVKMESSKELLIIELASEMEEKDELDIYIEYTGKISESAETGSNGLIYTTYKNGENKDRPIATANLTQGYKARNVFPCIDDANIKSTFNLSVFRRNSYKTVSNTELANSIPDQRYPGWMRDEYAKTYKMPTHMMGLFVSDFEFEESNFGKENKKPVRVHAPGHSIKNHNGTDGKYKYTAGSAAKLLGHFDSYFSEGASNGEGSGSGENCFGFVAKMDIVMLPSTTKSANSWSLLTGGLHIAHESHFDGFPASNSKDEEKSKHEWDSESKFTFQNFIAEQLAQQWVGNMWNSMYLNNGLVRYSALEAIKSLHGNSSGELKGADKAVDYRNAQDKQSSMNPYPGQNNGDHQEEENAGNKVPISQSGDKVQGALLFQMVGGFMTPTTLRGALRLYWQQLANQSSDSSASQNGGGPTHEDLFLHLHKSAEKDNRIPVKDGFTMQQIMHTWCDQTGHPLVNIDIVSNDARHVVLTQKEFHGSGSGSSSWYIPVEYISKEGPTNDKIIWLKNGTKEETKVEHDSSKWIVFNHDSKGHYRTKYSAQQMKLIQQQLKTNSSVIGSYAWSQMMDDYFNFAHDGEVGGGGGDKVDFTTALSFAQNLPISSQMDSHAVVWSTFIKHFSVLKDKMANHHDYPQLQSFMSLKIDSVIKQIGIEQMSSNKESLVTQFLRTDAVGFAAQIGSSLATQYAGRLFAQWQASPDVSVIKFFGSDTPIPSSQRGSWLSAIVQSGGKIQFDFVFAQFLKMVQSGNFEMATQLRNALLQTGNSEGIQIIFQHALDEKSPLNSFGGSMGGSSKGSGQFSLLLAFAQSNPAARAEFLPFMSSNIGAILKMQGGGSGGAALLGKMLTILSGHFSTDSQLLDFQTFTLMNSASLSVLNPQVITECLSNIKTNIHWMSTSGVQISGWLSANH